MTGVFITVTVVILVVAGIIYAQVRGVWKEHSVFIAAWKRMESFEKVSFQVGLVYYCAIPLLKEHSSKDTYIAQVFVDILTGLTNALFILGALAFLKHGHELVKERRNGT